MHAQRTGTRGAGSGLGDVCICSWEEGVVLPLPVLDLEGVQLPLYLPLAKGRTTQLPGEVLPVAQAVSTCSVLSPVKRKLLEKIHTPRGLASFQIPGLRLQMGYQHCLAILSLF